jgi:MFS family permease
MKALLLRNPFLLPVYVPTFLISFGKGMLGPILPLYVQSFADSYALVGLVLASQGLGTLLCDLPAGKLLNRLGQRRAMLAGLGLIALSYLAMSWAQSLVELFIYGLTAGVGSALWNISRHA